MPTFEYDDTAFSYLDQKVSAQPEQQVPFIFQHGIGGTIRQPSSLMAPLAPQVRLIALDSRGHGETQSTIRPSNLRFSFTTFADDLVALMDHLELPRAVVGGISMGAGIALNLALRFPERVAGMVLSRPAWLAGPVAATEVYRQIVGLCNAGAVKGQPPEDVSLPEFLPTDRPFARLEDLSSIRVPTLVVATLRDPVHPIEYGHTLAQHIPEARFLEVVSKSENPELHQHEMRDAIGSFLERFVLSRSVRPVEGPLSTFAAERRSKYRN